MHRKMLAKERTTGRKTGTRVVKDTESKEERDRIKNAKRAQQQRTSEGIGSGVGSSFSVGSLS